MRAGHHNQAARYVAQPREITLRDRGKIMPAIGMDDSKMAYRRGYQHGATETFRAVERFLDPGTREVLRAWIEKDVYVWRANLTESEGRR